ncbi:pyridoxamine 5'-phosphate oxidase family protein [Actinoallomurus sp. NPDC050550]|uniref:pyridoxamine 5'-phosphate oxidase family protein n=1 Tax=Actinoallomurus sp. NPDC050550 TaxID=3154937 RepID=UPI0033DC5039
MTAQARTIEELGETECLRLISAGGVGRIAYTGRFGPVVLPVNYKLHDGAIVFRTAPGSPMDEDLRTGISEAEYLVAFEIDEIDMTTREGWSVLIQGSAHHVDSETERVSLTRAGVEPWPGGERELFVRIIPSRITGRRIRRVDGSASG